VTQHHLGSGHYGGWIPQRPDQRDYIHQPERGPVPRTFELPGVDAVPKIDQGQQGSCTGHGTDGIVMFDLLAKGDAPVMSRAMIYYDARIPEGTTGSDSGATVRDAVKGVVKYGVCTEAEFPYNDAVCDVTPSQQDYADASHDKALVYQAVHYPYLNATLASGLPFVFGFTVYDSFMSEKVAQTGVVPVPGHDEGVAGGHCVWCFGYNATDVKWTAPSGRVYPPRTKACRNSWRNADGSWWGDNGNFYLPQWYFDSDQCSDFWVINRVG
jgi:C1A family cysteine protease